MPINYVLIDFENVQPQNLELLLELPFKVFVFVGANQHHVSIELAAAMQSLGPKAEYIQISASGRNALDFHIAFYVGQLSASDSEGYFHIISKDKGFDPLIKHLRDTRKIRALREDDIAEIPLLRISNKANLNEKIDEIKKKLDVRGQSRPRKVKTLKSTIQSLFAEELSEKELSTLTNELKKANYITVNGEKISYPS